MFDNNVIKHKFNTFSTENMFCEKKTIKKPENKLF